MIKQEAELRAMPLLDRLREASKLALVEDKEAIDAAIEYIERLEKVFVYTHLDECEKRISAAVDWYQANRHATAEQKKAFEASWKPENDRMFADADKLYQEINGRATNNAAPV